MQHDSKHDHIVNQHGDPEPQPDSRTDGDPESVPSFLADEYANCGFVAIPIGQPDGVSHLHDFLGSIFGEDDNFCLGYAPADEPDQHDS